MNTNSAPIQSKFGAFLATGLTVCGLLSGAQVAYSADAIAPTAATEPAGNLSEHFGSPVDQSTFVAGKSDPSYLLGVSQDEGISNTLLMFLFLVLPTGFGLLLWQHDKRAQDQLARLTLKIVTLERLWQQNPHH